MLFTYFKEYYVSYINPFTIFILISFFAFIYFLSMFIVIITSLRKRDSIPQNEVRIKSAILTLIIFASIIIPIKYYRYKTFDKYLVENKNNLVYTIATITQIKRIPITSKYDTIREYRAKFNFAINDVLYGDNFIVPKDYTNYAYFIKMNTDNIKYSELMPVKISDLPESIDVPSAGWATNPIDSIINSKN